MMDPEVRYENGAHGKVSATSINLTTISLESLEATTQEQTRRCIVKTPLPP